MGTLGWMAPDCTNGRVTECQGMCRPSPSLSLDALMTTVTVTVIVTVTANDLITPTPHVSLLMRH